MSTPGSLHLVLRNRLTELDRLATALEGFAHDHGIPEATLRAVTLALDELITNAIAYGYDDAADHDILVRVTWADGQVFAEVEDDGKPFNPLAAPPPDLSVAIEDRPVGGLGLHLVRSLMDHVDYRRASGKNHVVLMKHVR